MSFDYGEHGYTFVRVCIGTDKRYRGMGHPAIPIFST